MKARELGSLLVAGQKIMITESKDIPVAMISLWFAYTEDGTAVGAGWLTKREMPDTVGVLVQVADSHKRMGLGSLLLRIATDQAIYYRKRTMTAEIPTADEVAIKLLESEDFEQQKESPNPGFVLMKKELKWM